ncbi:MAG: DUF1223 domain-containing protein [Kordiimonas sp.]
MKKLLSILLFVAATFAVPASYAQDGAEEERLTVIELFTSQGCSSCPPADAILKTMRDRPGILTLSWAVDYWDRLGWEDTFATHYNSMRQTAYNKRLKRGGVFTPQMIFDGRVQCVGSKTEKVRNGVEKARKIDRPYAKPDLTKAGDTVTITLPATDGIEMVSIRMVWYQANAIVEIGDGENQGRTLHYTNIVRATELLDEWDGREDVRTANYPVPEGADHVAVLLQEDYGHGPIVGAATLALNDTP